MSVLHVVTDDRDHPAAGELQVVPCGDRPDVQSVRYALMSVRHIQLGSCARFACSLVAGDVEGNGTQHNLGSHALNSSPYSQVQLAGEGEVRRAAQVSQRLQGLQKKNTQHKSVKSILSSSTGGCGGINSFS